LDDWILDVTVASWIGTDIGCLKESCVQLIEAEESVDISREHAENCW